MKEKLRFSIEHGLFNTQYLFVIKQEYKYVPNCYGKSLSLVTYIELFRNNELIKTTSVVKHHNDNNQEKYAFYKVLNKLVFSHFNADRKLRAKIFDKFKEVYTPTELTKEIGVN